MPEISPAFLSKLQALADRYEAVTAQMNDPDVAVNAAKIVQHAQEHAKLARMVKPFERFKLLQSQADEARLIAADPSADADLRELAESELPELEARAGEIMEGLIDSLIVGDDADIDSIIVEIRAGTGGDEAALFARDLADIYTRYAEARGFKVDLLDVSANDFGGYKEAILNIKGPGVFTHFAYEGGGHRVQRVPITEAQGRIHTSAATVAVLPEVQENDVEINWEKDVLEHVSRAGGPGGQNVNKVSSAIRLEHVPTGITVSMRDDKSQHKNRAKARRILASRVKSHFDDIERAQRDSTRRTMIGSGDRSQRIRTYNFPQNRCTDHRVNESYSLEKVLAGGLDDLITDLRRLDRQERLQEA